MLRQRHNTAALLALAGLIGVLGCGRSGPKTYPVNGKVELSGADVSALAGSHVEGALESDMNVRTSGVIQADGSFTLETPHEGRMRKGAREGTYKARIIPTEEDSKSHRRAAQAVARRFLQFETSGLSFQVPTSGDVVLQVTPK